LELFLKESINVIHIASCSFTQTVEVITSLTAVINYITYLYLVPVYSSSSNSTANGKIISTVSKINDVDGGIR